MLTPDQDHETIFREPTRMEAFSDGVFSIAITLLVLELIQFIHIKDGEGILATCFHHWQPFLAFFIGFITILICWINHHHAFTFIKHVDGKFMWVNGFLLFMVTLTPFPTAILAEFLETEGKIAMAIYGFNYFMIALAAFSICVYAYRKSLIAEEDITYFKFVKRTYAYSILYTFLAFLVCLVSVPVALVMYVFLFFVFAFPGAFANWLLKRNKASAMANESYKGMNDSDKSVGI